MLPRQRRRKNTRAVVVVVVEENSTLKIIFFPFRFNTDALHCSKYDSSVSAVREAIIDTQAGRQAGRQHLRVSKLRMCYTKPIHEYTSFSHQMQPTWESLLLGEKKKE